MRELSGRHREVVRWVMLGAALATLVTFMVAQRQSVEVSYGQSPARAELPEEADSGLSGATVPSVAEMTALVDADPVVRLPGAIATWDQPRVEAALGESGIRILAAPPGLPSAARDRVRAVDGATIRVIGTEVTGGGFEATTGSIPGWRAEFAAGDVTDQLLTLIARLDDQPSPRELDPLRWREPSAEELATVTADLRARGWHASDGAEVSGIPEPAASHAFPDGALLVILPRQPAGEPLPRYAPALLGAFPDTPLVLQYGAWIEYHGPHADEFADVAAASFYGQFRQRLSRYDHPQSAVLYAYLNRIAEIRYAGLFDGPLPYQPFDPARVALPALPWLFTACVVVFLALSLRPLGFAPLARAGRGRPGPSPPARLAGLAALSVELSMLTGRDSDPALVRGIAHLQAARTALAEGLPDPHIGQLLDSAHAELDSAARTVGLPWLRPHRYLAGQLS